MSSLQDAINYTVAARRGQYETVSDKVALCVAMAVRTNQRWVSHYDPECLRDVYRGELVDEAAEHGSSAETATMKALNDKYTNKLCSIMAQCQLHANVVNKRLEFQTMLEQLETVKFKKPTGVDRHMKPAGSCAIAALPSDCWATVAEYLTFQDMLHLPLVSRQLYDDRDFVTWNTLYHRCFGAGVPLGSDSCWRREFKAKVVPMISSTYDKHSGGIPGVARFLEEVAPKGSFKMGNKNLLITRTDPIRMIQAARHGSQTTKLEVDELNTSRGPVIIITVAYNADGFQRGAAFETFSNPKFAVELRKSVAAVHFVGEGGANDNDASPSDE